MLALSPLAGAQVCGAAPKIGAAASGVEPSERFRMITSQCAALTTPMKVHRAAQLDLYDRPAVAITLPAEAPACAPAPSRPHRRTRRDAKPLPRGGERVLSLAPAITETAADSGSIRCCCTRSRTSSRATTRRRVARRRPRPDAGHAGHRSRFGVADPERALFDAQVNLRASAAYLQQLRQRYGDDLRLILAAYNAGEGACRPTAACRRMPRRRPTCATCWPFYRRLSDSFSVPPSGQLIERETR